jgi:predicted class III extradiol MEMO1 family dioxygenase
MGDLEIDTDFTLRLARMGKFKLMTLETDEEEHSIEL